MRVAVVDIGTNSTRLLVAEVTDGQVRARSSGSTNVTRLGEGVDSSGRLLGRRDRARAFDLRRIPAADRSPLRRPHGRGADGAVRDADNGPELESHATRADSASMRRRSAGEREARLTFLGRHQRATATATVRCWSSTSAADRPSSSSGTRGEVGFHVSTQVGSVRYTERTLHSDPPTEDELDECRLAIRSEIERAVPAQTRRTRRRRHRRRGNADPVRRGRPAARPLRPASASTATASRSRPASGSSPGSLRFRSTERRKVTGLHPDRAPAIVAGGVILVETMRAFGLDSIEVSEHDILEGAALEAAGGTALRPGFTPGICGKDSGGRVVSVRRVWFIAAPGKGPLLVRLPTHRPERSRMHRRLPPLEPLAAPTRHVPLPVLLGPFG